LLMVVGTSLLSQRFPRVREVLQSPPTLLVADGRLLHGAMNRERISPDELTCEMRKQDVKDLSEIRFAVLESDGKITFVAKTPREGTSSDSDD
jgi:uncharacterized membrane protein YcaP (DUF421 family)